MCLGNVQINELYREFFFDSPVVKENNNSFGEEVNNDIFSDNENEFDVSEKECLSNLKTLIDVASNKFDKMEESRTQASTLTLTAKNTHKQEIQKSESHVVRTFSNYDDDSSDDEVIYHLDGFDEPEFDISNQSFLFTATSTSVENLLTKTEGTLDQKFYADMQSIKVDDETTKIIFQSEKGEQYDSLKMSINAYSPTLAETEEPKLVKLPVTIEILTNENQLKCKLDLLEEKIDLKEKEKIKEQPKTETKPAQNIVTRAIFKATRPSNSRFVSVQDPKCRYVSALPFSDKTGYAIDYRNIKNRALIGYEHMQKRVSLFNIMSTYVANEAPLWTEHSFVAKPLPGIFKATQYYVPDTVSNMDNSNPKRLRETSEGYTRAHISIINKLVVKDKNNEVFQIEDSVTYINKKKNNATMTAKISEIFNTIDFAEDELNKIDSFVEHQIRLSILEKFEMLRTKTKTLDQVKAKIFSEFNASLTSLLNFLNAPKTRRPRIEPCGSFQDALYLSNSPHFEKSKEYLTGMIKAVTIKV